MILGNPEICETPVGKLINRASSSYRRDLNSSRATTGGLKLCVGEKKFSKKFKKIGQIGLKKMPSLSTLEHSSAKFL